MPRVNATRTRQRHPQVCSHRSTPPVDAIREGGHRLVPHAVGEQGTRARTSLLVLSPPAHDDGVFVATQRAHNRDLRCRIGVEAPI